MTFTFTQEELEAFVKRVSEKAGAPTPEKLQKAVSTLSQAIIYSRNTYREIDEREIANRVAETLKRASVGEVNWRELL